MRKIALLMMLAVLLGGFASEASAFSWQGFKARIGLGDDVKEMDKTGDDFGIEAREMGQEQGQLQNRERMERGVRAINQNSYYRSVIAEIGYERICLEVESEDTEEEYTLVRGAEQLRFEEGCNNGDFKARIREQAFEHLIIGLEKNDQAILADIYREGGIDVPWRVKLKAFMKCRLSDLC